MVAHNDGVISPDLGHIFSLRTIAFNVRSGSVLNAEGGMGATGVAADAIDPAFFQVIGAGFVQRNEANFCKITQELFMLPKRATVVHDCLSSNGKEQSAKEFIQHFICISVLL